MAFLDELLDGGSGYQVTLKEGGASFRPASDSDDDLDAFQDIVDQIEQHEGEGYEIHKRHETSERGRDLVDLLLIALAGEDE